MSSHNLSVFIRLIGVLSVSSGNSRVACASKSFLISCRMALLSLFAKATVISCLWREKISFILSRKYVGRSSSDTSMNAFSISFNIGAAAAALAAAAAAAANVSSAMVSRDRGVPGGVGVVVYVSVGRWRCQ